MRASGWLGCAEGESAAGRADNMCKGAEAVGSWGDAVPAGSACAGAGARAKAWLPAPQSLGSLQQGHVFILMKLP